MLSLVNCYDQTLKSLIDRHAPLAKVVIRSRPTAPWYDASCVNFKVNTRLERFYRARRIPTLFDAWRNQLKYQRYYMQERYREYWTNAITDNLHNSKLLWSKVSGLLEAQPQSSTFKTYGQRLRQSLSDKSWQHSRRDPKLITSCYRAPFDASSESVPAGYFIRYISKIIASSPDKRCPLDPASTWLIKGLCTVLSVTIAKIWNASFSPGVLPTTQKHAIVEPRLKKTILDPDDLNSYRPISNLSFLSKTIERVMATRFNEHVESHNLLPSRQSSYRALHSTDRRNRRPQPYST